VAVTTMRIRSVLMPRGCSPQSGTTRRAECRPVPPSETQAIGPVGCPVLRMWRLARTQVVQSEPTGGRDQVLVAATRDGSSRAFAELYGAHANRVERLVRSRCSQDEHAVADVVQEVFTRALAHIDQLRDPALFGAWVRSIAGHVVVDHQRASKRTHELDEASGLTIEAGDPMPDALVEAGDLIGLLRRSLTALSEPDATAITLTVGRGLSPAELGAELGVSPGAAKVRLHRARKRLRAVAETRAVMARTTTTAPPTAPRTATPRAATRAAQPPAAATPAAEIRAEPARAARPTDGRRHRRPH